jgi:hypothetical protein
MIIILFTDKNNELWDTWDVNQGFLICSDHEDSDANDLYISDQEERASTSTRSSVSSDVTSEDDSKPVEKKRRSQVGDILSSINWCRRFSCSQRFYI